MAAVLRDQMQVLPLARYSYLDYAGNHTCVHRLLDKFMRRMQRVSVNGVNLVYKISTVFIDNQPVAALATSLQRAQQPVLSQRAHGAHVVPVDARIFEKLT